MLWTLRAHGWNGKSAALALFAASLSWAQTIPSPDAAVAAIKAAAPTRASSHIALVIPNYQTVSDPDASVRALTSRQKFDLFVKSTVDPFTSGSALLGAAMSQASRGIPDYGNGKAAFGKRFGAALGDVTTQSFFSGYVFASLLHEDPRYFRLGPRANVLHRVAYAVSRTVMTRRDDGRQTVNWANLLGTTAGIGASNLYYPQKDRTTDVMGARFVTSFTGAALGNLLPEFWPDVQRLFHRHRKDDLDIAKN